MPRPIHFHWKPSSLKQRLQLSQQQTNYLTKTQSLTARLRRSCPEMQVVILSERWQKPLAYEAKQLGLNSNQQAWVRCVLLKCHDQALIYARTVIPNLTQGNPWFALKKLGNQPLGEILFQQKNLQRSPFLVLRQKQSWPYLNQETANYPARCSLFCKKTSPLLLTEVFLQELK